MTRTANRARAEPRGVFLNCPYDAPYRPLFRAIVFAIYDSGFVALPALARSDGAEWRLAKIVELIERCPLGIHDLSRTEPDPATGLPRFNMPLELGLFLGARHFGDPQQKAKRCLVFDSDAERYLKFISDIRGQDPKPHGNDPKRAIVAVRDWLDEQSDDATILPGGDVMARRFDLFVHELPLICAAAKLDAANLSYRNEVQLLQRWLRQNQI